MICNFEGCLKNWAAQGIPLCSFLDSERRSLMNTDTIAAIATGIGGGISIIRISGDDAFNTIDKIYKSKNKDKILSKEKSHTIHYGFIVDEEEVIDEVMVAIMRAPSTYTREDVVEINFMVELLSP